MTSQTTIAVIDSGYGNFASIGNALCRIDPSITVIRTSDRESVMQADGIILPGVGAFELALEHLHETGLDITVREVAAAGEKPILGICLGLQILSLGSEEFGWHDGLGLIDIRTQRLTINETRLPHVGWNNINSVGEGRLTAGMNDADCVYFDHSFALAETAHPSVVATADYGASFVAIVERGTVMGVQFHPEISGSAGQKILRNYLDVVGHVRGTENKARTG